MADWTLHKLDLWLKRVCVCVCVWRGGGTVLSTSCQTTDSNQKKHKEYKHDCGRLFWGEKKKKKKFNATETGARKNRFFLFLKPKLVQNTGLCGNSQLPDSWLRKPHDKANLKRYKSGCFLKRRSNKKEGGK